MYSIPDPVSKLTMFSHPSIGHHKTSEIGLQMWNLSDFLASFLLIPFLSLKQVTESSLFSMKWRAGEGCRIPSVFSVN